MESMDHYLYRQETRRSNATDPCVSYGIGTPDYFGPGERTDHSFVPVCESDNEKGLAREVRKKEHLQGVGFKNIESSRVMCTEGKSIVFRPLTEIEFEKFAEALVSD
jgi:hypothetical protein